MMNSKKEGVMVDPDIYWKGASGERYGYWIHIIGATFEDSPGNYIYAKETRPGYWSPVYIGQTSSLADRLADHENETCAKRNGATHIHTHTSSEVDRVRISEETDLIKVWNPICNQ
jgi:predicted GIY-YIG superfamily endonuclease